MELPVSVPASRPDLSLQTAGWSSCECWLGWNEGLQPPTVPLRGQSGPLCAQVCEGRTGLPACISACFSFQDENLMQSMMI